MQSLSENKHHQINNDNRHQIDENNHHQISDDNHHQINENNHHQISDDSDNFSRAYYEKSLPFFFTCKIQLYILKKLCHKYKSKKSSLGENKIVRIGI